MGGGSCEPQTCISLLDNGAMYDQILVPTDGSQTAKKALRSAVQVARQNDADLHVLHVIDEVPPTRNPGMLEEKQKQQQEEAEQLVEDALAGVDTEQVRVERAVRHGRPDEAVLDYAQDLDMDLVIMGRHGRSGLDRWLLGSTTERVLRSSSLPVLVIPPADE
jgi:nucleotide-binding universal stress UspA family protein